MSICAFRGAPHDEAVLPGCHGDSGLLGVGPSLCSLPYGPLDERPCEASSDSPSQVEGKVHDDAAGTEQYRGSGDTFRAPPRLAGYDANCDHQAEGLDGDEVGHDLNDACETQFQAVGNLVLLKKWRMLPMDMELQVRRFKWLQAMVRHPDANEQAVAAIFGRVEVKGDNWNRSCSALTAEGHIDRAFAGAHLLAFEEAVLAFEGISGTEDLFEAWAQYGRSWKALLLSKYVKHYFLMVDSKLLSSAFVKGLLDDRFLTTATAQDESDVPWRCNMCSALFRSKAQLISHQVNHHKLLHPLTSCISCNACPICYSTFASVEAAKQHVRASYRKGHCRMDVSHCHWKVRLPSSGLKCHLCSLQCNSDNDLLAHLQLHLPKPLPAILPPYSSLAAPGLSHAGGISGERRKVKRWEQRFGPGGKDRGASGLSSRWQRQKEENQERQEAGAQKEERCRGGDSRGSRGDSAKGEGAFGGGTLRTRTRT